MKKFLPALAIVAIAVLFSLTSCTSTNIEKPDIIILVSFDTLRWDHLGMAGYPYNTSPFLDSIAQKSVLFTNAFSHSPQTAPSHTSMFTGLNPRIHGVANNATKFSKDYLTMAQYFADAGYKTAAFSHSDFLLKNGVLRGFDDIVIDLPRKADVIYKNTTSWLKANYNEGDKIFLFVHFFDVHGPYTPPSEYLDMMLQQGKNAKNEKLDFLHNQHKISKDFTEGFNPGRRAPGTSDFIGMHDAYDAEIRYADAVFEKLYTFVEEHCDISKSLWIITADHGEGLGNGNYLSHSLRIETAEVRVPLLFHIPSKIELARKVSFPVRLTDIFPSIKDIFKFRENDGSVISNGFSLFNTVYGFEEKRNFNTMPIITELPPGVWKKAEEYTLPNFFGSYFNGYYLLVSDAEQKLYDLSKDYYMTNDISQQEPEVLESMLNFSLPVIETLKQSTTLSPDNINQDVLEELKGMGYLQ